MRTPPKNRLNLAGSIFGKLTVIDEGPRNENIRQWNCVCECGNTKLIRQDSLRSGRTISCGCFHSQVVSTTFSTHRRTKTVEYRIWQSMKGRCGNPKNVGYALYGGRGIKVCDRWLNDFPTFLSDMGPRPSPKYSLDRIDNSKGYEPSNCRWATIEIQGNNKRNNHYLTHNGETLTIAEWSRRTGIPDKVLRQRAKRSVDPTGNDIMRPYSPSNR